MSQYAAELVATANAIATPGKGILAADESTGTIGNRFLPINVENIEENRRRYRELLFNAPKLGEHISGVICYEETLFQNNKDGTPFVDVLNKMGICVGIKVDMGVKPLYGTDGETVTQGITDLDKRCQKYYAKGARFAKWRSVLCIKDSGCPSQLSIDQNAATLARYAAICQANGLVPIVEPEILMDGKHDIQKSAYVTEKVLAAVYKALSDHHVLLEGTLLKPNMVRTGADSGKPFDAAEIAKYTVRTLDRTVPATVPGITFLSGGMSEEEATLALNAINKQSGKKPWKLTFSYGRALQQTVLKVWQGKDENVVKAQEALISRAKANGAASVGKYDGSLSASSSNESLHVKNYSY